MFDYVQCIFVGASQFWAKDEITYKILFLVHTKTDSNLPIPSRHGTSWPGSVLAIGIAAAASSIADYALAQGNVECLHEAPNDVHLAQVDYVFLVVVVNRHTNKFWGPSQIFTINEINTSNLTIVTVSFFCVRWVAHQRTPTKKCHTHYSPGKKCDVNAKRRNSAFSLCFTEHLVKTTGALLRSIQCAV